MDLQDASSVESFLFLDERLSAFPRDSPVWSRKDKNSVEGNLHVQETKTKGSSTGKLIDRRTNTTTTDITTRSLISEQRPQEIAHVTYLTQT